jgi:hypothetical protein
MRKILAQCLACGVGAVLMLAFLHTWGHAGESWLLLDDQKRVVADYPSLGDCWTAGERYVGVDRVFECIRQ